MRRLIYPEKKLRGVPRRLRAMKRWSEGLAGHFPSDEEIDPASRYWNFKIPVDLNLVEGRGTNRDIQRACAQNLVNACGHLLAAKPAAARDIRVTCVVCLPDMFTSELCIYLQEEYFLSHTSPAKNEHGETTMLTGRSLSQEWALDLPPGVAELGTAVEYHSEEDDWHLSGERWYFGEVLPRV